MRSRDRHRLTRLEERQRIADELHDDVAQLVFGAQLSLDRLLDHDDLEDFVVDAAERARTLISRVDGAIRSVIHDLDRRPVSELSDGLAAVVADVEREFQVAVHLEVSSRVGSAARNVRASATEALVKVARECLVNVAKHAGPCRAIVKLETTPDQVCLTVVDDGIGPVGRDDGGRHGIASLLRAVEAQGGSLIMSQGAARGTHVTAVIPR